MDRTKIFQSVIKGTNFFTPIIDSYHTVGNHIIELSCSEKDNQHGLYNREEEILLLMELFLKLKVNIQ